jgi:hypothetical protein
MSCCDEHGAIIGESDILLCGRNDVYHSLFEHIENLPPLFIRVPLNFIGLNSHEYILAVYCSFHTTIILTSENRLYHHSKNDRTFITTTNEYINGIIINVVCTNDAIFIHTSTTIYGIDRLRFKEECKPQNLGSSSNVISIVSNNVFCIVEDFRNQYTVINLVHGAFERTNWILKSKLPLKVKALYAGENMVLSVMDDDKLIISVIVKDDKSNEYQIHLNRNSVAFKDGSKGMIKSAAITWKDQIIVTDKGLYTSSYNSVFRHYHESRIKAGTVQLAAFHDITNDIGGGSFLFACTRKDYTVLQTTKDLRVYGKNPFCHHGDMIYSLTLQSLSS